MQDFMKRSEELKEEIIDIRRCIHKNPECGDDLPITTQYVMNKLKDLGLEPKEICKSGVVAIIKGDKPGKTILLRADMDALPMEETSNLPFASKNNYAHTCGHDLHTAMLLGAAKMLLEEKENIHGNIKLMFQPAEEIFTGSQAMLDNGLMENPKVDASLDMHVMTELPVGYIAHRPGYATSSCDGFEIIVKGIGCHGAQPQNGIDPINVASHIHLSLQALISRETPPDKAATLTVCQIVAGNTANIIPETAVLKGTMRTFDKDLRTKLKKRFKEVVEYTAKAFAAEAEIKVLSDVPSIYVDKSLLEDCLKYIGELDYNFNYKTDYLVTASDDYARISELVPSIFIAIGAGPYEKEKVYPNHNPNVIFNEDCLPIGSAIFAKCAIDWLRDNS